MKSLFKKLTQNYRLSMWLASSIFVLSYAFASLYSAKGFLSMLVSYYSIVIPKNFVVTAICCLLFGLVALGLFALCIKFFIFVFKIYIVPYSEALFITLLVFTGRNIILGCLNLLIVFNPVFYTWGGPLFFLLATIPFIGLLYYIFDKYYIHVSASPNIFKVYCLYWLILLAVRIFIGMGGVL